jgi:hypothetical protein
MRINGDVRRVKDLHKRKQPVKGVIRVHGTVLQAILLNQPLDCE